MPIERIPVRTPTATYTVEIGPNLLPAIAGKLDTLLSGKLSAAKLRTFVITSPEIADLHATALLEGFRTFPHQPELLTIPAGEAHKRLRTVERLAEELAEHNADRDSLLLALGGGVLGDLTGFLAAIYMRGIRYAQLPTTALAMIDSSVGGKTGANLAAGKNLIGAFHHPIAVFADTDTLKTLPRTELRAGLQEGLKAAIIRDRALFDYLEANVDRILAGDPEALQHVIAASVRIKAEVVGADEHEGGLRMILNLGHTLGHALEAATNYTHFLHGEAIAWGMLAANHIALNRGTLTDAEATRISNLIQRFGPLKPFTADPAQLVALTAKDKKNRGTTRSFILPVGIGDATIVRDVTETELLAAATQICREGIIQQPA
jgi:3-dehydroquinate synthase